MKTFYTVWFGQLISTLGSATTTFAIGLWIFRETGSVALYTVTLALTLLPLALVSPLAGAVVDRRNRRAIMIVADTVQAASTLAIGGLLYFDALQVWHIYAAIIAATAARAFQGPAWGASIPLLVPKTQLGRVAALGRLNQSLGRVAAPALAGALLVPIGLAGIVLVDLVTFLVAVGALLLVHIPNPPPQLNARSTVWRDVVVGWRYLRERTGLFLYVWINSLRNLFVNLATALIVPLLLLLTNEAGVGTAMSVISGALVIGSLTMSVWGGPQRRMHFLLVGLIIEGVTIFSAGLHASLVWVTAAFFVNFLTFALVAPQIAPIIQTKVAADVQGRVFAMMNFLGTILEPLGTLSIGLIVDRVLQPAMETGGALQPILTPLVGAGAGRGMAVVFLFAGTMTALLGVYGLLDPRVRRLEAELPDALETYGVTAA